MVNCTITSSNTFAVSYDDKNNLKVWDIQERSCIQTILSDPLAVNYSFMMPLPFKDNFIVFNKGKYKDYSSLAALQQYSALGQGLVEKEKQ